MEKAWNFGVQLNRKFLLFDRILNINLDYYRTNFTIRSWPIMTQVGKVNFYNLDGDSYSNCHQVEVKYELIPGSTFWVLIITMMWRPRWAAVCWGLLCKVNTKACWICHITPIWRNAGRFHHSIQRSGTYSVPVSENSGQADRFDSFRIMNAQISKFSVNGVFMPDVKISVISPKNILSGCRPSWRTLSTLRRFGGLYTDVNFISAVSD